MMLVVARTSRQRTAAIKGRRASRRGRETATVAAVKVAHAISFQALFPASSTPVYHCFRALQGAFTRRGTRPQDTFLTVNVTLQKARATVRGSNMCR